MMENQNAGCPEHSVQIENDGKPIYRGCRVLCIENPPRKTQVKLSISHVKSNCNKAEDRG
jgi:hypothetical protein